MRTGRTGARAIARRCIKIISGRAGNGGGKGRARAWRWRDDCCCFVYTLGSERAKTTRQPPRMMRSDVVGCHWVMQQSEANNRDDDDDDDDEGRSFDRTSIATVAILKQTEASRGNGMGAWRQSILLWPGAAGRQNVYLGVNRWL